MRFAFILGAQFEENGTHDDRELVTDEDRLVVFSQVPEVDLLPDQAAEQDLEFGKQRLVTSGQMPAGSGGKLDIKRAVTNRQLLL